MSEEEREILDIDVLFVGAGPASLAGAYHLGKLIEAHNEAGEGERLEPMIAVLEKGEEIGSHALSGAVVDPKALQELMPDDWQDAPFEGKVEKEGFLYMTKGGAKSLPVPPPLVNKGKYVASLGRLMKWLAPKLEEMEIDVFCEFPAQHALYADNPDGSKRVIGLPSLSRPRSPV
ncbi:MAG: electron transfer flavoprotein-ubiquinone oxidoreductase, partial [Acidobacteriota bacterium]